MLLAIDFNLRPRGRSITHTFSCEINMLLYLFREGATFQRKYLKMYVIRFWIIYFICIFFKFLAIIVNIFYGFALKIKKVKKNSTTMFIPNYFGKTKSFWLSNSFINAKFNNNLYLVSTSQVDSNIYDDEPSERYGTWCWKSWAGVKSAL